MAIIKSLLRVYPLPILKMAVLHVGHVPLIAGFPFFMVYGLGPPISRLSRHLTQYPIVINSLGSCHISENLLNFFYQVANLRSQFLCFRTIFFVMGYFFLILGTNYYHFLNNLYDVNSKSDLKLTYIDL